MPRRGPEFGPAPDIFAGIPPDVMETIIVLAEIELSRRERWAQGSIVVERETRSPAQIKITGTSKRMKARKILDAIAVPRNDPMLK